MDFSNLLESPYIKDYLYVLLRKRDIIITFFVTTVLVVTLGSFLMRPTYRAKVALLIDVESPNVLSTTGGPMAMQNQDYYSYKDYLQTQIEILTSRPVAHQVINELKLMDLKGFARAKDPVKQLLRTVKVEPVRDTRLINVYVDNKNPELAAKIANSLAEIYVRRNLVYISKNELLNLLKNEFLRLQNQLSEYEKVYKEDHPEMIKLKQEINSLVEKLAQQKKIISNYGVEENADSSTYKGTLEGLKANNVSIIEPAETPINPIKPKKVLNILLALIFGASGGVGLAFFLEYLDDMVRGIEEVEHLTNWPLLGSVVPIDIEKKMSEFDKDIFVHSRPKDPASEAYRSFRTNVVFSSTEEHPIKSLMITSPGQGEGKIDGEATAGIEAPVTSADNVPPAGTALPADDVTPVVREQIEPVKPKGKNAIVLAHSGRIVDLQPVVEHFAEYGIELKIVPLENGQYQLRTVEQYVRNPATPGTDAFEAKRRIIEVGALYEGKAPAGLDTFGKRPFSDAYGMRVED